MIKIRSAKIEDIPQLVILLKALFNIEADFEINPDKQSRGLKLLLNNDKACVLVAELIDDNKILGMCSLQTFISTAEGGEVGFIEDLIVDADYRHQGIATKLLTEIFLWARQKDLTRIQLLADKTNTSALAFYEQQHWQSTQLICLKQSL
ncbi:MAG: GNAT family N-acetyltransferase [Methylococcales bacterium]